MSSAGRISISSCFQHGLQDGYLSLKPHVKGGLFPLTLARKRCFATFAGVGGGGCDPPLRFQTKRRRASRKRPAACARRVLAIGSIIFGPRSIFDPVMAGQRSNFRKFRDFLVSRVHISKSIGHSDMKSSPAYSPFNSA